MNEEERVLIVGAGIGGLALAIGLERRGLRPVLVERAPGFGAVGAGIILGVNAMAMLRRLGLDESARRVGHVLGVGEVTDRRGRCLSRMDFRSLESEFGPTIAIHRAFLHELLLSACSDLESHTGTTVERLVDHGEVVEVELSDGSVSEFDRVIGADGLHSRTRTQIFGETPPTYAGYTCWRFVVRTPRGLDRMQEMWGVGKRLGLVPIGGGRVYCFACANAPEGDEDPLEGRIERFRKRFAEFEGHAPAVVEQLERADQLIHNDLAERPGHAWHRGRVLLIGDAAHAMTPNMGQGAAMALEDAVILVEMLASGASWERVLPAFIERRGPRVRFVADQSRRIGWLGQLESRPLAAFRNGLMKLVPQRIADATARRAAATRI
ncbi:MAG TPA: FAD-dependent oxidoreductase [Deltaproteobacteria bacterium]|nr:FAD-dependent oxidoreductase [Deltaproteobacteria bacterium]